MHIIVKIYAEMHTLWKHVKMYILWSHTQLSHVVKRSHMAVCLMSTCLSWEALNTKKLQ